jgi:NAD(P)-dependent dehydrogenase (short-subunit alcohol dehydrogenase family)
MKRLQDKVALITGAGAGIGKGVARRFAAEGAALWLADIDAQSGAAVAAEIADEFGVAVFFAPADFSERAQVEVVVAAAMGRFGRVDVLVNDAWGAASRQQARLPARGKPGRPRH